jgi:hypothetical protein
MYSRFWRNYHKVAGTVAVIGLLVLGWRGLETEAITAVPVMPDSIETDAIAEKVVSTDLVPAEETFSTATEEVSCLGGARAEDRTFSTIKRAEMQKSNDETPAVVTVKSEDVPLAASAKPVTTSTIVKTTPEVVDMTDYTNALDYATALGYVYEENTVDSIYDAFSEEEIYYLQRMVETETQGCCFISKVYTAEVGLARYYQNEGKLSLVTIITSPSQFTYWRTNISQDTIWAVEYAYQHATEAQNALFFKKGYSATWYGYDHLFECPAGHDFYGTECELAPIATDI